MSENQIYTRSFDSYSNVADLLQTFINRGYNLTEYFINITAYFTNWQEKYVVFYDKRYESEKSALI